MNLEYQAKQSLEPSRAQEPEPTQEPTVLSVLSSSPEAMEALSPRERAFALENSIRAAALAPVECPLRHFFADGVYVREIFMPAGAVIVGHIHKHEHVAIMQKGDISIYDETGLQRMKGPHTFISKAGIKRALYIHEDTIFSTIHRLRDPDERDLDALKKEYVTETNAEYEQYMLTIENKGLLTPNATRGQARGQA
jgi:hypothetical protein